MPNHRAFTPPQEQEMVARYQGGAFLSEIARDVDKSPAAVKNALLRQDCALRPKADASRANLARHRLAARAFTPQQERELVARYQAGAYVAELAQEMGTSQKAVNNALRRQGCALRDRRQARHHADARRRAQGKPHRNWRGGRTVDSNGYVLVEINQADPMWPMVKARRGTAFGYGYILEHRLVMARAVGRPLDGEETVHHINGDRADNRLENLQLRRGKHGHGHAFECADCGSHNIIAIPIAT